MAKLAEAVCGALTMIAVTTGASFAQSADFYSGKTITIIVGFTPGGGFDAYARLLARYLGGHIPGRPSVIVENLPGAGSLTAVRAVDATRPRDGTVIATFNSGLITQSIMAPKLINLDFRKFTWIGSATSDVRVCYGYGPKGIATWEELMQAKAFVIGVTAKGVGSYINGAMLQTIFHAPVKLVMGFPGSAEIHIAIEQGELDGDCSVFSSIPLDWVQQHKIYSFVRFSKLRPDPIPDAAIYVDDLTKTETQRQLVDFLDAADEVGRPFVASADVPTDRVAILRKAFDDTMKDPAFVAEAEKEQLPVNALDGRSAEEVVKKMIDAPRDIVNEAARIVE